MNKIIYMDNAATTALKPEVFEKMKPFLINNYANPSAVYSFAQEAKAAVDNSRDTIAQLIGARSNEIYFTCGGSESDNWAIKATALALKDKGNHIITSKIEHHAVLHTCEFLEKNGFEVTYLDVDENGFISLSQLEEAIRPTTILISIMYANNEIGTIEPVKEIGKVAKEHDILFHTDAVQAFSHIPINVNECNIDMMSVSGHKFHGPKGVGFLYIRNSIKIGAFIHGGAQERARRAGTLNVAGIVGMACAAKLAHENMEQNISYTTKLRDYFIQRVENEIKHVKLNGDRQKRLPNNINFCIEFVEGESLLIMLDQKGICASSGSACTSGSLDPSHVLTAIGLTQEQAHTCIRLSISKDTTKEEVDFVVDEIKRVCERLRSMSPLYGEYVKNNS